MGLAGVSGLLETSSAQDARLTIDLNEETPFPPASLVSTDNPSSAAILHHRISAQVFPADGRLVVRDRMTIAHSGGAQVAIPFLLWKELEVTSAEAGDVALSCVARKRLRAKSFWERPPFAELAGYENARHWELSLTGTSWPETLEVTLEYEGTIRDSLQAPKAAYARSFETTSGLIQREGSFLSYGSFWVPTRPEEVFTFDLEVTLPEAHRVVSQGQLKWDRTTNDGMRQARWLCRHPMEEVYLVTGPWEENHLRHGDVMAQTYTYADTDSTIYNRYLRGTGRYLDRYEEAIGPYPFAKFALVENFWQSGFGMPSFTLLGDRVIRLPFILDTSYGHEILHNWWGNGVFVDASLGNWCEGLTTYGADYAYEEDKGSNEARRYRLNALQSYRDYVSDAEDMPLASFRARHDYATQAVGYSKSMMVVHQLRRQLGDQGFQETLRDFYRDNLWKRASWKDLFESGSRHGSIDPDGWYEQWIAQSGAPSLSIENLVVKGDVGHHSVSFDLVQEEETPYRLLVPVKVTGPDGVQVDKEFAVEDARTPIEMVCGFEPRWVEVDPDFHVMRRLHDEEVPVRLSGILGSDEITIVIAAGLDAEVTAAFRSLAEEWSQGHTATIVESADFAADASSAVWYFGADLAWRGRLADTDLPVVASESTGFRSMDGHGVESGAGLVVAGRFGEQTWGLLHAETAEDVAALGRKVPHYGRYSYLAFTPASDGAENTLKGVWPAGQSPLRVRP